MIPKRSPYGLIQEDLWPNEWLILIVCMMLNCTSRKQVEKVLPAFIEKWPSPMTFINASKEEVAILCKPLGFVNKRTKNMFDMTQKFLCRTWKDPRELPGVGEYVARSYEIFCIGKLGTTAPKDHALVRYWAWRQQ